MSRHWTKASSSSSESGFEFIHIIPRPGAKTPA
jgi:hypothetical protein